MSESVCDLPNQQAESLVRSRFLVLYVVVILPLGLLGSDAISSWESGRPLDLGFGFLAVETSILLVLALGLGSLSARAIVLGATPAAVAIDEARIVGDFRRRGWKGDSEREIRYEDVREIRRTYLLRIPMIRGHPDYTRSKPIRDAALFYLSETNLERVRRAVGDFSENGGLRYFDGRRT